jgi:multiple antibiotic resistance protein
MREFWLSFVPLLVAVDAVGVLPLFLGLTEGLDRTQRTAVIRQSVLTATAVALTFVLFGGVLLRLLGITVADFMVAGGALLFVLSLTDLLAKERSAQALDRTTLGAVPLGVPLLTGPAVLTTGLLLVDQYGVLPAAAALLANMALAALVFLFAGRIHSVLGTTGTRIVQRVTLLLLAAIAVMTVRKGVETYLQGAGMVP